jgi:multidrug efflux pump subunit AcrA (membrane-fusion protein)
MSNAGRAVKWVLLMAVIGVLAGMGVAPYIGSFLSSQQAEEESPPPSRQRRIICTGRVEATEGEIDVMPQLSGELEEVLVSEGDRVKKDDLLAMIDARREAAAVSVTEANLDVVRAELDRVLAGSGEEEIQAAARAVESADALVEAQRARVDEMKDQGAQASIVEEALFQLKSLEKQREAARNRYEALRRGALPEDVQTAKAAVALAEKQLEEAKTNYEYRRVVAAGGGVVLKVYRHKGDSVQAGATPVVQIADTDKLRIRLEADETEAHELKEGMEGSFSVRGSEEEVGRLVVGTVVPAFGPKRLFNPDTSARVDTRTLELLCDVKSSDIKLYPGQRITAEFVPESTTAAPASVR